LVTNQLKLTAVTQLALLVQTGNWGEQRWANRISDAYIRHRFTAFRWL